MKKSSLTCSPSFRGQPEPPPLTVSSGQREPSDLVMMSLMTAWPGLASLSDKTMAPAPSPNNTQVPRSAQLVRLVVISEAVTSTVEPGRRHSAPMPASRAYRKPEQAAFMSTALRPRMPSFSWRMLDAGGQKASGVKVAK